MMQSIRTIRALPVLSTLLTAPLKWQVGLLLSVGVLSTACPKDQGSSSIPSPVEHGSSAGTGNGSTAGNGGIGGGDSTSGNTGGTGPKEGTAVPPPFEGTTQKTEVASKLKGASLLKNVRVGAHDEGYDRVVFEFDAPDQTGYRIEYVKGPVTSCGSGEPVTLEGNAFLSITFVPANAHTEDGKSSIETRAIKPGYKAIRELKQVCDFEGQVQWVLGVANTSPYRVVPLSAPTRLAVDIRF